MSNPWRKRERKRERERLRKQSIHGMSRIDANDLYVGMYFIV